MRGKLCERLYVVKGCDCEWSKSRDGERVEPGRESEWSQKVDQSWLSGEVTVVGATRIEESSLSQHVNVNGASHVKKSKVFRTAIEGSEINDSIVTRSVLKDCNVEHCEIEGCTFASRELKYGIWKNGTLVGRTREDIEPSDREHNANSNTAVSVQIGRQIFLGGGICVGNMSMRESRNSVIIRQMSQSAGSRLGERPANFLPPKRTWQSE